MRTSVLMLACCLAISVLLVRGQGELNLDESATESPSTDTIEIPSQSTTLFDLLLSPVRRGLSILRRILLFSGSGDEETNGLRMKTFQLFMRMYNRTYSPEEIPRRLALFVQRMRLIEQSVELFREGKETFVMKPNRFIDWTDDELKTLTRTELPKPEEISEELNNTQSEPAVQSFRMVDDDNSYNISVGAESIPRNKDWRNSGCVAAPIDQDRCGSCYAVATLNTIESTKCIHRDTSAILSPQQVVDCASSYRYNAHGCDGGWPTSVFRYLQNVRSISRERCYPYRAARGRCMANSLTSQCQVDPSLNVGSPLRFKVLDNENDVLYHVAKTGPVTTVLKTTRPLLYYGAGIMKDPSCSGSRDDVDHALTIVGYGTEGNTDYWLIKNSWGTDWGQGGYAKVKRGYTCSIARWGWVLTDN